jgi:hypothetical protein
MALIAREQEEEQRSSSEDTISMDPNSLPGFSAEQSDTLIRLIEGINARIDILFMLEDKVSMPPTPDSLLTGSKDGEMEHQRKQFHDRDVPVTTVLRAKDVGFFDPEYQDGTTGHVTNAGKHVIYRDVYIFVERLKNLAYTHADNTVMSIIPECFRGAALMWHLAELSESEKAGLRTSDLATWYSALIKRWKMPKTVALATLTSSSFGLHDIGYLSPRAWILEMRHCAKAANLDSTYNQLTIIRNRLDVDIRLDIPEPSASTTWAMFYEDIDSKTSIWRELADRLPQQYHSQQRRYPSSQQQHPPQSSYNRQQQKVDCGDSRDNQGRFAPNNPIGKGRQQGFTEEPTPDGYVFHDGDDDPEPYVNF